jgi:hypothetical protein
MYKIGILVFMITIISCRDDSKPFEVSKHGVTITLPGYLKEDELADDAILEYANRYRNFYIAGFELPSNITLDSAQNRSSQRIYESLGDYTVDYSIDADSNRRTKIIGHFKEEPESLFYYQKIIDHQNHRFLLTVWIRGEERQKKYADDIEAIINSFKLK